jgi:hypothetical protein
MDARVKPGHDESFFNWPAKRRSNLGLVVVSLDCCTEPHGQLGVASVNERDALEVRTSHPIYDMIPCPGGLRRVSASNGAEMSRPVIFTISAAWDQEASVWSGHCDDIPAAADAPTLDELLEKISAMALDLLPDNHPDIAPESLFLQITALREAEPVAS